MNIQNITILGLGSWGFSIGLLLHENGFNIKIWDINQKRIDTILKTKKFDLLENQDIPTKDSFFITDDLEKACENTEIIIFAVPSFAVRDVALKLKNLNFQDKIIISLVKGLEDNSYLTMSEVIDDVLKIGSERIYTLSGPTHAEEVSKKMLTTILLAGENDKILEELQKIFSNKYFRVYVTKDKKGVEFGGAVKNIIAIACGISDGIGLGDNIKAAIITRGLTEIVRLGKTVGANPQTFFGLSGLGDLIVTCLSQHSRNRNFGERLGRGEAAENILKDMKMVVEGVNVLKSIYNLAKEKNVEMPIINEIYNIIYNKKPSKEAVSNLMSRELKEEKIL